MIRVFTHCAFFPHRLANSFVVVFFFFFKIFFFTDIRSYWLIKSWCHYRELLALLKCSESTLFVRSHPGHKRDQVSTLSDLATKKNIPKKAWLPGWVRA